MPSATILTVAAAIAVLLSPLLASMAAARAARRSASGTIATSSADVLWKANQDLIVTLQAENAKLIEQRDRIVALMDEKIAPALAGIAATQVHDGELLAGNARMLDAILRRLEGAGHGLAAPPG